MALDPQLLSQRFIRETELDLEHGLKNGYPACLQYELLIELLREFDKLSIDASEDDVLDLSERRLAFARE